MNQGSKKLLEKLSHFLDPNERDVVLGDIAELNLEPLPGVRELCGLIVRRQISRWKAWRPWLAFLGVGLIAIRLIHLAVSLVATPWRYVATYRVYGVRYGDGLSAGEDLILWLSLACAVVLWSWTGGLALTWISRKTAAFAGALLLGLWLAWNGALFFVLGRFPLLFLVSTLPVFVPALFGGLRAFRGRPLTRHQTISLAVLTIGMVVMVTWTSGWPQAALEKWSEGAIQGSTPWYERLLPYLLLSWPAAWITTSHPAALHLGNTQGG